ncbi:MAG: multiheme c-type cytochrome [Nitrospiraceae bacterium]|nr:multiheme c-type cytochrome [Nitrospiraceae bacterium]
MSIKTFACMFLFITLAAANPCDAPAATIALLKNAGACMGCHNAKDMFIVFGNKEKMSVTVSERAFSNTVHAALNCTDCHRTISLEGHPGKVIGSKNAFLREASAACRSCHSDDKVKAKPHHAYMAERADTPPCTECHGSHGVLSVARWKATLRGHEYCLTCHSRTISKTVGTSERLSLRIDQADQTSSVHNKHDCSDCHTEYTADTHPVKTFADARTRSIVISGVCAKCHEDKHTAVRGSMHYNLSFRVGETLVSRGRPEAPVCTDCHGFHTVGAKETYETLSGIPCRKCHENIFAIYAKSVHGMAKARGEHRAPLCASCHFAHEINFTAMSDKIKAACLGCHEGIEAVHGRWLPNAELHLAAVACAACHAPSTEKGIYLQLIDEKTGRPVPVDQMLQVLGITGEELSGQLDAHGQGLDSYELAYLLRRLNLKGAGAKISFLGKMDVMKYSEAHQLSLKKYAVRKCEDCHSPASNFFKKVTLAVVKTDGGIDRYRTQTDVLKSIFLTESSKQFYALGGTRIAFLDWAGIFIVFCGLMFPVVHVTLRIFTAPVRRAKKADEAEKGKKS